MGRPGQEDRDVVDVYIRAWGEFRSRVVEHGLEEKALGLLLARLAEDGLIGRGGKARADSTHASRPSHARGAAGQPRRPKRPRLASRYSIRTGVEGTI